jgi:hypothetical protein
LEEDVTRPQAGRMGGETVLHVFDHDALRRLGGARDEPEQEPGLHHSPGSAKAT